MAVTLIADAAGTNSNSYLTVAAAQAYIDDERLADPPAEWVAADENKRAKALITATGLIDANVIGMKYAPGNSLWRMGSVTAPQALRFPRAQDVGIDGLPLIPGPVQEATVELALYLLSRPSEDTQRRNLQAQGIAAVTIGKLTESYRTGAGRRVIDACPEAAERLRPYGYGAPIPLG